MVIPFHKHQDSRFNHVGYSVPGIGGGEDYYWDKPINPYECSYLHDKR